MYFGSDQVVVREHQLAQILSKKFFLVLCLVPSSAGTYICEDQILCLAAVKP